MTVKLYKDGDTMAIKSEAEDEQQFIREISQLLSEMIDEGVFEVDWAFQLGLWLPQIADICSRYRMSTMVTEDIAAGRLDANPPLIALNNGTMCTLFVPNSRDAVIPVVNEHFVENRHVCYVSPDRVTGFDKFEVFKFIEGALSDPGVYQGTFSTRVKMEYRLDKITRPPLSGRGVSCFMNLDEANKLFLEMKYNLDRLFMFRCVGYNDGKPPWEYLNDHNRLSVLVRALQPVELLYSYNELSCRRS